jgi:perosamine synthetase
MIPRGLLDIRWSELRFAAQNCFEADEPQIAHVAADLEQLWEPTRSALACLSVRTGWDLVLQAMAWPPGSEILMSAVTIRDMAEIVRRHQLVPVPLDVDPETLAIDPDELRIRITPRTKAVLVAHLFGSRSSLADLAAMAHEYGLQLIEDAAQAYVALGDRGDPHADVSFFSFGPIKAQTALGGGLVQCRDPELCGRLRRLDETSPRQTVKEYRRRVRRFSCLHLFCNRSVFTLLTGGCRLLGVDYDQRLTQAVRGFGGGDLLQKIRRRPSFPLLQLLRHRLAQPDRRWLLRKSQLAQLIREELDPQLRIGGAANYPTHWVLPIRVRDPDAVCRGLIAAGFDATRHASNMTVILPTERSHAVTPQANHWTTRLIYLPLHPGLTDELARQLARLVNRLAEES